MIRNFTQTKRNYTCQEKPHPRGEILTRVTVLGVKAGFYIFIAFRGKHGDIG